MEQEIQRLMEQLVLYVLGAENVKILYRRTIEEMTAYEFEYEFAKQDGVEFRWLNCSKTDYW